MTKIYCAGFMFMPRALGHDNSTRVILIEKNRPDWQKGKLNAVGGRLDEGETPAQAMVREFNEETGIVTVESHWREFCLLDHRSADGLVHFFSAHWRSEMGFARSMTDENIHVVDIKKPKHGDPEWMRNLDWLIPMALDTSEVVANVVDMSVPLRAPV
jgi:8-oxo-dGTP diphosphatase